MWQLTHLGAWQFCDRDLFGIVKWPFQRLLVTSKWGIKRSHWITWRYCNYCCERSCYQFRHSWQMLALFWIGQRLWTKCEQKSLRSIFFWTLICTTLWKDIPLFWRETLFTSVGENSDFHIRNVMPGTRRSLDEQSWGLALRVAGLQVGRVTWKFPWDIHPPHPPRRTSFQDSQIFLTMIYTWYPKQPFFDWMFGDFQPFFT